MQKKYTDIEDLRQDIIKAYTGVGKLSRKPEAPYTKGIGCAYGDRYNGVGCGLGCVVVNREVADTLDQIETATSIHYLYRIQYHPDTIENEFLVLIKPDERKGIHHFFADIFDVDSLGIDNLSAIQAVHDDNTTKTVEDFLSKLKSLKFVSPE